jgi:hypothetical protein
MGKFNLLVIQKGDSPECKVHIFADKDQDIRELPEIVRFLKRLSVPIAPDIEAKAMVSAVLFQLLV